MPDPLHDAPGAGDPAPASGSIPAGPFSPWLDQVVRAIEHGEASDVPCGTCTACCRSSQFVHIAPDEADTLAHVPDSLTFPAPGLPPGHLLLGYDDQGRCPLLVDGACSIYDHRPRTCRTYDCRVFPATGLTPDDDKPLIGERAGQWRFSIATDADRARLAAVRAAAGFLRDHADELADLAVPTSSTQRAVLAIEIHGAFLAAAGTAAEVPPVAADVAAVRVEIRRARTPPGRRPRRTDP